MYNQITTYDQILQMNDGRQQVVNMTAYTEAWTLSGPACGEAYQRDVNQPDRSPRSAGPNGYIPAAPASPSYNITPPSNTTSPVADTTSHQIHSYHHNMYQGQGSMSKQDSTYKYQLGTVSGNETIQTTQFVSEHTQELVYTNSEQQVTAIRAQALERFTAVWSNPKYLAYYPELAVKLAEEVAMLSDPDNLAECFKVVCRRRPALSTTREAFNRMLPWIEAALRSPADCLKIYGLPTILAIHGNMNELDVNRQDLLIDTQRSTDELIRSIRGRRSSRDDSMEL